ncbi:hypothetical protein D9615_005428 [Tricholomella constricta]|uniref:N-acetyltransferase domain-containing protein n=1 Tax=Tricholomella constricta TaxID=117010 RepID=A0A8H5HEE6_9AGAR|nr:hypothetical protein D9615_005428 [Tricholomella constricta]
MADASKIIYDWLASEDIAAALIIEQQGYPIDEAANLEAFEYRQSNAGDLFLGAYLAQPKGRELVGYVCSTLSPSESLTHESMSTHVPSSTSVCVHSVCVSPTQRRRKIGLNLLREYIRRLEAAQKGGLPYKRILLITHENLRQFYEQAGFEWVGKSSVVHGALPWYEMRKVFGSPETEIAPSSNPEPNPVQQVPAGIWDALQRASSAPRPTALPFSAFPGGTLDLVEPHSSKLGASVNKYDLLCPRIKCGSIILKRGVGQWVERASVQMEPGSLPSDSILAALPAPPETCQWWLITPSPMEFENIGFSRPVQHLQQNSTGVAEDETLGLRRMRFGAAGVERGGQQ